MYAESDYVAISALQHFLFCRRQCALIHIEQLWQENRLTAEGRQLHQRVHTPGQQNSADVHIAQSLAIHSRQLGLIGKTDLVELYPAQPTDTRSATNIPKLPGCWQPRPVEYKRGRPKKNRCDEIQLCAQAICLEEMLDCEIPTGDLYYGQTRRRKEIPFDETLRTLTANTARALHQFIATRQTPPPQPGKHCKSCSLADICLPERIAHPRASIYLSRAIQSLPSHTETQL